MNKLTIEINREYTKKQVNKIIDNLYNDLKKMSLKRDESEKELKRVNEKKVILAKAYAKKIGVILTQKQYNKEYPEEDPLDEIFVDKHDTKENESETGGGNGN